MITGTTYYYITDKGTIGKDVWCNSYRDIYRESTANIFKTFKQIKIIIDKNKMGANIKNKKEIVLCAAIWFDDGQKYLYQPNNIKSGFVLSGWRHGSIFQQLVAMKYNNKSYKETQGFLTSKNRFLDRIKARELVLTTGQLSETGWKDELYSEDLY